MKFPGFRWSTAACAACALAVAVLAAGCSVAATATPVAPPPEQADIAVDVFPTIDFAGLFIAQMDGLFKQQGLNVTIRFAPAGQLAVTSVLNGTSDIAGTDYVTYFPLEGYAVSHAWAQENPRTAAAFDRALTKAQQIADTDRAAVEAAAEKFLGITPETAAVINLPGFPLSVAPAQLQRVVDTMVQFGMLPPKDISFKITKMTG